MISLIIGLGNIGIRYAETRHNIGFDLLDLLSLKWKFRQKDGPGDYYFGEKEIDGRMIRFIWPTSLMNNSGIAALQAMAKYNLTPADILVIYDDFNLPLGKMRIRASGSDGGHNGMESIIFHLRTEEILRLRLGTGPLPENMDPTEFVLGRFSDDEVEIRNKMLEKGAEAVLYLLSYRPEEAMTRYNQDPAPDKIE
jgi:PTH1 family peptidyl-tRNA hydrolase